MAGRYRIFKEKYPHLLQFFYSPRDLDGVWIGDTRKFNMVCEAVHIVSTSLKSLQKEKDCC